MSTHPQEKKAIHVTKVLMMTGRVSDLAPSITPGGKKTYHHHQDRITTDDGGGGGGLLAPSSPKHVLTRHKRGGAAVDKRRAHEKVRRTSKNTRHYPHTHARVQEEKNHTRGEDATRASKGGVPDTKGQQGVAPAPQMPVRAHTMGTTPPTTPKVDRVCAPSEKTKPKKKQKRNPKKKQKRNPSRPRTFPCTQPTHKTESPTPQKQRPALPTTTDTSNFPPS